MKLDTSEPKDWKKFVDDLNLFGVEKLLLQNCRVFFWNFPRITLVIGNSHSPFISKDRIKSLESIFNERYECNNIKLNILVASTYEYGQLYPVDDLVDTYIKSNPNCKEKSGVDKKLSLEQSRQNQIDEALRLMTELVEHAYEISCELEEIKLQLKEGLVIYR